MSTQATYPSFAYPAPAHPTRAASRRSANRRLDVVDPGASPQGVLPFTSDAPIGLSDADADAVGCRASIRYSEVGGRRVLRLRQGQRAISELWDRGGDRGTAGSSALATDSGCAWALDPYRGDEFAPANEHRRYRRGGEGRLAESSGSLVPSQLGSLLVDAMRDLTSGASTFDELHVGVQVEAVQSLREALQRRGSKALEGGLALGESSDPYQSAERRYRLTRGLLEELATQEGLRIVITTRSPLILRDIELLTYMNRRSAVEVRMVMPCAGDELGRVLEPSAPLASARWRTITKLAERGLGVTVVVSPLMPGINAVAREMADLVQRAKAAGATQIDARVLTLKGEQRKTFFSWLSEAIPAELRRYRGLYGWRDHLDAGRERTVMAPLVHHCLRHGLPLVGSTLVGAPTGAIAVLPSSPSPCPSSVTDRRRRRTSEIPHDSGHGHQEASRRATKGHHRAKKGSRTVMESRDAVTSASAA